MTAAQSQAMKREINKQILARDSEYWLDIDACTLWVLHKRFGFGKRRLRRFYESFQQEHERLREYYEMTDEPSNWICRVLLKRETGVDVEEWEGEQHDRL